MATRRTSRRPEILVSLQRGGDVSLSTQIQRSLRDAIRAQRLRPGTQLPSSRTLALDLGVSRGVIVDAYEQLVLEGYLVTATGSQTRVADAVRAAPGSPVVPAKTEALEFDFRPGEPDLDLFPRHQWRRAMQQAISSIGAAQLGYGHPEGVAELRVALADYLARVRGVVCRPDHVVVCTGAAQGIGLVANALAATGVRRIALEDPGHPEIRRIVIEAGLTPVPIAVDEDGLQVQRLERARAQAVMVSPAHQNPIGGILKADRRRALLAWARGAGGYIIEDDYDAEYLYDRSPVGAVQGLDSERVVYLGSASKILAPALRLGWLVLPDALLDAVKARKRSADNGSPVMEQLTYAAFIERGELDRHVRKMRRVYVRRRNALVDAMRRVWPRWRIVGAAAGLHVVAIPPPNTDLDRLIRVAAMQSIRLYSLQDYAARGPWTGLVLGYARLSEDAIRRAFDRLARL